MSSYEREGWATTRNGVRGASPGVWRPDTVRGILIVYKGVHHFGKRSRKTRDIIERPVPPLVSPELWEGAQAALRRNMIMSKGNAKRRYLLRGLIKCGQCGMTYSGSGYDRKLKNGTRVQRRYYTCI